MRVLIAGCGYVGLPLGAELRRAGHQVFGLRRGVKSANDLESVGIDPIQGDLTDPVTLRTLPTPFDWVINCAASGGGTADDYRRIYVEGNSNLVERLSSTPPACFVYTSSTGVYGQDDGSTVYETSATEPTSATGGVLVEAERTLARLHQSLGWPVIVLRLAGIYGPGRGYWLNQFLAGTARLEEDGQRVLNMIHRDDVVGAALHVLEQGPAGETYNVVDDEPVTQLDFYKWLAGELKQALPPSGDASEGLKRRGTNKRVSNRKLRRLGWRPKYATFREGMKSLLDQSPV